MKLAPIVLFAYKRPDHTLRTLESLQKNHLAESSSLYIFIDGLKDGYSEADFKNHSDVIKIASSKQWCAKTEIKTSTINLGLATSVVNGVTEIINQHGRVIVLEDDLITSTNFLEFMNASLEEYENNNSVACVSGYVYPLSRKFENPFFIKGADCWGWATWKSRWSEFDNKPELLLSQLTQLNKQKELDFNGTYPYTKMLVDRVKGENQSWAICWYTHAFLKNMFCLYPPHSLVHNIGNDGSGTNNSENTEVFDINLSNDGYGTLPKVVSDDNIARKEFELFFKKLNIEGKKNSISNKIISKIKSVLKK